METLLVLSADNKAKAIGAPPEWVSHGDMAHRKAMQVSFTMRCNPFPGIMNKA